MSSARYYGFTRFSVHLPGDRGWKASRLADEYTSTLFDDTRMQLRADIFTELALPIYQSWADLFTYRHVVHISSDLPSKWRSRLEDAARRYPCLLIDEVTDRIRAERVMKNDIRENGGRADLVVRLRVDDDDLLAADYIDALDRYVTSDHVGFAVSFGLGIAALYRDGEHSEFRLKREVLPSPGQAYIGRYDRATRSIIGIKVAAHNKIDTAVPVIFDSREPMYLQTYHGQQDKEFGRDDDPMARLARHPQIEDPAVIDAKFPTVRGGGVMGRIRAQIEASARDALARMDERWPSQLT